MTIKQMLRGFGPTTFHPHSSNIHPDTTNDTSFLYSLCTEDTWKATTRVHRVMEDW